MAGLALAVPARISCAREQEQGLRVSLRGCPFPVPVPVRLARSRGDRVHGAPTFCVLGDGILAVPNGLVSVRRLIDEGRRREARFAMRAPRIQIDDFAGVSGVAAEGAVSIRREIGPLIDRRQGGKRSGLT